MIEQEALMQGSKCDSKCSVTVSEDSRSSEKAPATLNRSIEKPAFLGKVSPNERPIIGFVK